MTGVFISGILLGTSMITSMLVLWNTKAYVRKEQDIFMKTCKKNKEFIIEENKRNIDILLHRVEKLENSRWF